MTLSFDGVPSNVIESASHRAPTHRRPARPKHGVPAARTRALGRHLRAGRRRRVRDRRQRRRRRVLHVAARAPRAGRAQYGNCPGPQAATPQNQIQGPPPPTTDNGTCIVLIQGPPVSADVPAGLDLAQLVEIGLELSGMSPNQASAFQKLLDAKSTLVLSMPRGMRSYAEVSVAGTTGVLVTTASRRGPTYSLV